MKRTRREHRFIETDGQIYLVQDGGVWRFPRASEAVPFEVDESGRMDFGDDLVVRLKPRLSYHPEEWFNRDDLFSRTDVDGLVKKAVYMTMPRLVAEAAIVRGHEVLMVKAKRGFSQGYWNLPGGFLDFGEPPEVAVEREVEEEIGVEIALDGLLGVYHSGFPGKPTYTMGFVYRARTKSTKFLLKEDEIEAAEWFPVHRGLALTRNPFVRWGLVDLFRQFEPPPFDVSRHGILEKGTARPRGPAVFLDRDGVINRGRPGYVRTPDHFEFLDGAAEAVAGLTRAGYRIAIVSNQDAVGWKLIPERQLRRIHDKMIAGLQATGGRIDEIYVCPHHVLADCPCRKPRPGLLLAGARDLNADPAESWMIGDKVSDGGGGEGDWRADRLRRRRETEEAVRERARRIPAGRPRERSPGGRDRHPGTVVKPSVPYQPG